MSQKPASKKTNSSEPASCRPKAINTVTEKGRWGMNRLPDGNYALIDPNGTEVVKLFEPLHMEEIEALANAFTKTVLSGVEQGRAKERQRIRQLINLAYE